MKKLAKEIGRRGKTSQVPFHPKSKGLLEAGTDQVLGHGWAFGFTAVFQGTHGSCYKVLITMKGCHDNSRGQWQESRCEMLLVAGTRAVSGEERDGVRVWIYSESRTQRIFWPTIHEVWVKERSWGWLPRIFGPIYASQQIFSNAQRFSDTPRSLRSISK